MFSRSWSTQKPPSGSQIDWSHPLANGLVGCWLFNTPGNVRNLVNGQFATFPGVGSVVIDHSPRGIISDNSSYEKRIKTDIARTFLDCALLVTFIDTPNHDVNYERLAESDYNTGFYFGRIGTAQTWGGRIAASAERSLTLTQNVEQQLIMTRLGATHSVISNGGQQVISGSTSTTATDANPLYFVAPEGNSSGNFGGEMFYAYMWERGLTVADAAWLYTEPYAFIHIPRQRTYSIPASVVSSSVFYQNPMRHMLVR
jgi:hypothetical protein